MKLGLKIKGRGLNFSISFNILFRYFSFNQWIQTFDQYSRLAKKKGFWTSPVDGYNCPSMQDIPCKAQTFAWKDLNGCSFNICNSPPEFGMTVINTLINAYKHRRLKIRNFDSHK